MSQSDDYRAIYESAVLGALSKRSQIAVAGADRAGYLQGLLTNDITALTAGSGCYATWLTPQGRMLTDLEVLESGDIILLDVPAATAAPTLEKLDQFLFSEDVQLASLADDLTAVWLHGPAAASLLEGVMKTDGALGNWPNYRLARLTWGDASLVVVRNDQLQVPGYCVYLPPASRAAFEDALRGRGARDGNAAALEAARIEAGYPLFGVDMTDDTIPLEAGIEGRAISLTKGCYVGQEVIIRVLHRGHGRVARRLVALRLAEEGAAASARIAAGDRDIGFVTSTAVSPVHGAIALGYVHRDFVEPGTTVAVRAGDSSVAATVATRPL